MQSLILTVLPLVAAVSYTSVHYGQFSTVATLFQLPSPADFENHQHDEVTALRSAFNMTYVTGLSTLDTEAPTSSNDRFAFLSKQLLGRRDDSDESDGSVTSDEGSDDEDTSWASFEPDEDDEEKDLDDSDALSDSGNSDDGSVYDDFANLNIASDSEDEEDSGRLTAGDLEVIAEGQKNNLAGIMQLDCKMAPEACKNACYYERCMRKSNDVIYEWGGDDSDAPEHNRVQSGVSINWGTPCRTWPFAQRFWDRYAFRKPPGPIKVAKPPAGTPSDLFLQTDEWPMASMMNADFKEDSDPPQVSLRCIRAADNSRGGGLLKLFANAQGAYKAPLLDKDGKVKKTQTPPNREVWAHHHFKGTNLVKGDKFKVNFNFDSFAPPGDPEYKRDKVI